MKLFMIESESLLRQQLVSGVLFKKIVAAKKVVDSLG